MKNFEINGYSRIEVIGNGRFLVCFSSSFKLNNECVSRCPNSSRVGVASSIRPP